MSETKIIDVEKWRNWIKENVNIEKDHVNAGCIFIEHKNTHFILTKPVQVKITSHDDGRPCCLQLENEKVTVIIWKNNVLVFDNN